MIRFIAFIFLALAVQTAAAQENDKKEVCIGFRVGSSLLDPKFGNNEASLNDVIQFLNEVRNDTTIELTQVTFCGSASPEGGNKLNRNLAKRRCANMEQYVRQRIMLPEDIIKRQEWSDAWQKLAIYVENSDMPNKKEVLHELLETPEYTYNKYGALVDSRKKRLMDMNYGRTWNYMLDKFFPSVRNASAILVTIRKKNEPAPEPQPEPVVEEPKQPEPVVQPEPIVDTKQPAYFAIKTNMLYDALLVPNVGVEFSLGKRWSVAADWMYGWWSRNKSHRYWRVYGGGLTVRKYFGAKAAEKPLQGHHIGINAQMLTYDIEFGGKGYMGGKPGGTLWDRMNYTIGAEYGYSMPVARRLNIDFSLAAGYMGGRYYEYTPLDGHYVWQATKNRKWIGPTKVEVSLVWLLGHGNYNTKTKKGGEK
ncbi:DUF3575 domain-containing protein [Prevotella sp.]|uniref:DUF3575 domain-containing protein n=1 Tax=Prevotella sp. TaxID=59823 RepID=UPI0025F2BE57|nr:DUF3575 domain-containing protein [Prevotella sp.]